MRKWVYALVILAIIGAICGYASGHCKLCKTLTQSAERAA